MDFQSLILQMDFNEGTFFAFSHFFHIELEELRQIFIAAYGN